MRIVPIFVCICALMLPLVLTGCFGSSTSADPEAGSSGGSQQTVAVQDKTEIPIGAPVSRVVKDLGPADSTDVTDDGREIWRYSGKRAEYVYASNSGNVQTLVIGRYIADPQPESPGQGLLLTIVFDNAKKVADFNFALMRY